MGTDERVENERRPARPRRRAAMAIGAMLAGTGLVGAASPTGDPGAMASGLSAAPQGSAPKVALGHWALRSVAVQSAKKRLGNVADPSLVQLDDGGVRLYFKNGNEEQAGITGHDNLVHSLISDDGGRTWKVEAGARNSDWQSAIDVLPDDAGFRAFGWILDAGGDQLTTSTSVDGTDFPAPGDDLGFDVSACDTPKGTALILGDPSIAQLRNGKWVAVVQVLKTDEDDGTGMHIGYGCTYRSNKATDWSRAKVKSFGAASFDDDDQEVVTNPAVYRRGKVVERWTPASDTVLYETSKNGRNWKGGTHYLPAADPERLDLEDGTELLAFDNFDGRFGGVIVVAEKVLSDYTFQRQKGDSLMIQINGTEDPGDVEVWNLCANKRASKIATASVEAVPAFGGVQVTVRDTGEPEGLVLGCYYALVGESKILG